MGLKLEKCGHCGEQLLPGRHNARMTLCLDCHDLYDDLRESLKDFEQREWEEMTRALADGYGERRWD